MKERGLQVSLNSFNSNLACNKKTFDYWSRDMLNFNFSEKGVGLVSPAHSVYDFSREMFLMLHSIK